MNTFTEYYSVLDTDQKQRLADKAETSPAYLYQIASGHRDAGWKTIQKLLRADSKIKISMFEDKPKKSRKAA